MTNRDEYVAKLKKQLDAWNDDMARWEAKAKTAQAEMKERYKRELDVLNAQRELARYNLRLLEDASTSAWTEMRKGADEAWDRMRAAAAAAGTYFEKAGDKKK
jgi:lipid II:glycine glycyltransferase (peptidoglycan interpeptide bridge formation enzyme)